MKTLDIIERKNALETILSENGIKFSLRVSVKINISGEIDTDRYTYAIGVLTNKKIQLILSSLTDNEEAKEYILSRNNSSTYFILALDKETVKFYLDSGFKKYIVSMISVEIYNTGFRIRNYTPIDFDVNKMPVLFKPLLKYVNINMLLERDDRQNYLRFTKSSVPTSLFYIFNKDPKFVNFIELYGYLPVWFQFSEKSFTFYFKIK